MKAFKIISILLWGLILASCGDPVKGGLEEIAQKADKIELYIINKASLNEVLRQSLTEGKPLVAFANKDNLAANLFKYISEEPTPEYKCGSDGVFKFLASGKVLFELEFNLNKDCRHFAFASDGKAQFRKITPEGLQYFSKILMVEGM